MNLKSDAKIEARKVTYPAQRSCNDSVGTGRQKRPL